MSVNEEKREGGERIQDIFSGLDEVVRGMEKEDVSLEQSFDLYYKGMELLKRCGETIDRIEKKMVMLDDKGEEHEF